MRILIYSAVLGFGLLLGAGARAADPVRIVLKDNQFTPSEVRVPAGERFRIELENQGSKPAEFESAEMKIEKIVAPGSKITVIAGPLAPGSYPFADEYNPQVKGVVTAVQGLAEK